MYKFQCVYTLQSKTHHIILDGISEQSVRDYFQNYIVGDLIEIRKIVHVDNTIKKDDGDYLGYAKIQLRYGESCFYSFRVPKIKKSYVVDEEFIKSTLKIVGFKPDKVQISLHKN